jgi:tetratricopeptide (TPR) repeat protein
MRYFALSLTLALSLSAAQQQANNKDMCAPPPSGTAPSLPAKLLPGQGEIHFPITTSNPEAQKFFNQGVAQMHSFWAVEAERSFLQAAQLDPEAPMPWWGVAMVAAGDYRPRFQLDTATKVFGPNRDPRVVNKRAVEAAEKARQLSAKATEVEKMYIASIVARRLPPRVGLDSDEGYIAGLKSLVAKYPKEVEAKTYLALHTMRGYTLPSHTPNPGTMEAVQLLRELLVEAPEHMGVHHYVIHGFEGATFAKDAWPSCKRYAELVPNIPHALHMPGHIYSQTGRWADAAKSFSDAAVNELGWINADKLYGRGHHGHNVHYLSTALSFAGRYDEAIKQAQSLLEFKENPREAAQIDGFFNVYRQGWFAMLRALVQGERWDDILAGKLLPNYGKPREQIWLHWARGLAFVAKGDATAARNEAKEMDAAMKDFNVKVKRMPNAELQTARLELDAHIAAATGRNKRALNVFKKASDKERAMVYSEPPYYPRPVAIPMGNLALKLKMREKAEEAFRIALEQYPANVRAESGLRAASELGGSKSVNAGDGGGN